jgi:Flp pilus assembly protein TadB
VRRRQQAAIITDAAQSPAEELRQRQTRYIVMMLVRAGCLVLAAVLAMLHVPLLAVWVALCLAGAVILPWLAVIWANNKRPRPEYRLGNRFRSRPAAPPPDQPALGQRPEPTVIDADQ